MKSSQGWLKALIIGMLVLVPPVARHERADAYGGQKIIRGDKGNNLLKGTSSRDRIYGSAGNDRLFGRSGNDLLLGGIGRDLLVGGRGDDRLYGGPGRDTLKGGSGNDLLSGGPESDRMHGGPGRDRIYSRDGKNDYIDCGTGRDTVYADIFDRLKSCERVVGDGISEKIRPLPSSPFSLEPSKPQTQPQTETSGRSHDTPVSPPPEETPPNLWEDKPPNIILIVTDDQRFDTVTGESTPGDGTRDPYMPNVTSLLADQGIVFNQAYSTRPLCCPSRSSILTGKYAHSHGVHDNGPGPGASALPFKGYAAFLEYGNEESNIATWLDSAGYETALVGRYMIGYPGDVDGDGEYTYSDRLYLPPGWDRASIHSSGHRYYNYSLNIDGEQLENHGSSPEDYSTTALKNHALEIIGDSAGKGSPFFLYFAPIAPHDPAIPAPGDEEAFTDPVTGEPTIPAHRPPAFNEADVSDKPSFIRQAPLWSDEDIAEADSFRLLQLQSTLAVDRAVSEMVNELDRLGELDNTYIFYISDNGYIWGEHRGWEKTLAYEESARMPLLVRGPGIDPGTSTDLISANIDLAPTFAEIAGLERPGDVDGRSLMPILMGEQAPWRSDLLIEKWEDNWLALDFKALVSNSPLGHYKLVQYYDSGTGEPTEQELYDLDADPNELESLHANPVYSPLSDLLLSHAEQLATCSGTSCL